MDKDIAPVFVKINDYKEILDIIDVIKHKIKEAKETLERVNSLRVEEEQEFIDWNKNLDEMTKRMAFLDKTLFEPNI